MLEYFVFAYCAGYVSTCTKSIDLEFGNTKKRRELANEILSKISEKLKYKPNTKERDYGSPVLIAISENFCSPRLDIREDPLFLYCKKEDQDMEEIDIEKIDDKGINPKYIMEFLATLKESLGNGCPDSIINCLYRLFASRQTGTAKT